ncbi:hypothetical protein LJR220_003385 [Bradyrhizobium sp. LjRoot220]|uniref:hypothetical protein n=1 Tax=Bradyrhizobium sp. LjRoot220 TaxID=3342284 RepID=UPI003ECE84A3
MLVHFKKSAAAPVFPTNLTAFVRSDLSFDIPAIKAAAKARYDLKLDFINRYTGAPKRYWQRSIARRVIRETWLEAGAQRHQIVWSQLPRELPFTATEATRREMLRARMACAPVTLRGNLDYRTAAAEYGAIGHAAQRRAYQAILDQTRETA